MIDPSPGLASPAPAARRPADFFVTGTDTGVGKTLASCALLHAIRAGGATAVGMKPVAAGVEASPHGPVNGDVLALCQASSAWAPVREVNPYSFDPSIAPHLAAREAGVRIELPPIVRAFESLRSRFDAVVVEGVGGFLVPLNEQQDAGHLAMALGLPVVLVVGMRLGCLNHALLTRDAIAARSLVLAGWIANLIDPQMLRYEDNLGALIERIDAPLLGVMPHQAAPDPAAIELRLPSIA
jgi:dethiobiotin synthetase